MTSDLIVKKGDTRNAIKADLFKNDKPMDLTGCEVLITISGLLYRFKCMIKDGVVVCPLNSDMTSEVGTYEYEFIVVHPDGREETVPNNNYFRLRVIDDLDAV